MVLKNYLGKFKNGNKREKTRFICLWAMRILALGVIIFMIVKMCLEATETNYSYYVSMILQACILITLSYVPVWVEKIWKVDLPFTIVMIFLFMSLCAFFFGEIGDFYIKYEWWDDFLHTFAGLYMAACAFFILSVLNQRRDVPYKSSPGFVVFFAFMCALAFECLWEMIEYVADTFFATNMQRAYESVGFAENGAIDDPFNPLFNGLIGHEALEDTMGDIFEVVAGAIVTCTIGYIGLKHDDKIKALIDTRKQKISDAKAKKNEKKLQNKSSEKEDDVIDEVPSSSITDDVIEPSESNE